MAKGKEGPEFKEKFGKSGGMEGKGHEKFGKGGGRKHKGGRGKHHAGHKKG